jgi:pilus assembly protein CpaE
MSFLLNDPSSSALLANTAAEPARAPVRSTAVVIAPGDIHRQTITRALEARKTTVAGALTEYPSFHAAAALAGQDCDAFIVELDSDSDAALDLVEILCGHNRAATVMVYCRYSQPELLVASMRAGAREFLTGDIDLNVLSEALARAGARRAEALGAKRSQGKALLFLGAKGGSGTTTLAANFAVALRRESGQEVALVDLNPQLGDVSLLLGVTPRFTISDALVSPDRLDDEFLNMLVTSHPSGVSILAAPDVYTPAPLPEERTVGKFLEVVSGKFPYIVIDAGLSLGKSLEPVIQFAGTVYLVTQVDIPSLRNSQRLISYLGGFEGPRVELVLNRYESRKSEVDEDRLSRALGKAPNWRVPNDFASVRKSANTGASLFAEKTALAQTLHQMARQACGKLPEGDRKKGFRLFS